MSLTTTAWEMNLHSMYEAPHGKATDKQCMLDAGHSSKKKTSKNLFSSQRLTQDGITVKNRLEISVNNISAMELGLVNLECPIHPIHPKMEVSNFD